MNVLRSTIIESPILDSARGVNIDSLDEMYFSNEYRDIILFKTTDNKYILNKDIVGIDVYGIIISSALALSDKEDLVRYTTDIGNSITMINYKVHTESGKYLGKVSDIAIDDKDILLSSLTISPKLSIKLRFASLLIYSNQIIKINKNNIIVDDAIEKILVKKKKSLFKFNKEQLPANFAQD